MSYQPQYPSDPYQQKPDRQWAAQPDPDPQGYSAPPGQNLPAPLPTGGSLPGQGGYGQGGYGQGGYQSVPGQAPFGALNPATVPTKDTGITYLLWFFLGWIGVHHFYLRRTAHGVIYLVAFFLALVTTFTFVGFFLFFALGIGWLVDAFLIPGFVRATNIRITSGRY